jgi:hypothetical protein
MAPAIRDWTPQVLDALFGVVQDATANPEVRRKAALKIAEFLLPKAGKKPKVIPDEYGFSINPNLASAYRDIQLELRALVNEPTRKIPAIAEKIKKLEARSDAIRRRLQVPCPTKYGNKEAGKDYDRLMEFTAFRDNQTALTAAQTAEEAHLRARFDVFAASPESIARRRRQALQDAERRFKMRGFEMYRDHPFQDACLAPDGNFYPRHSKLRPGAAADGLLVQTGDGSSISPVMPCDAPATDRIQSV